MRPRDTRLNAFLPEEKVVAASPATGAADQPLALPVSALIAAVNATLDEPRFADVWVRGEVSGFRPASSGHWYFDLKDENAVLNVAMFAGSNRLMRFRPEDGMEVLVRGKVAVYSARSTLQIVAKDMRPVGAGALQVAFEQLKRRLAAEGLFDQSRKRSLPQYPRRVGVVTSLGAAALRDIIRVAVERNPGIQLLISPARVQGDGAASEIANAISRLNATDCEVMIVGRGGGSIEDLWAFNEEVVVRAIAASHMPVVSAVGHETDFTLSDLAADLRAATPSNAAEIIVPDADEIVANLDDADARMAGVLERLVPDLRQRLDDLASRSHEGVKRAILRERELLAVNVARLDALSPLATLARGFSVVKGADGKVVRSYTKAPAGAGITVHLADGSLDAKVTRSSKKEGSP
ncbi:MAG: exodeoxyribonuclease VII large subunit [Candidatus Thermoplasmatota archaeon]